MKWDGVRALAYCDGGRVRLVSRTGQDVTGPTRNCAPSAAPWTGGRPCWTGRSSRSATRGGRTSRRSSPACTFATRRGAPLAADHPVTYLAFDLLHLDGRPLLDVPYEQRRALLDGLGLDGPYWQVPPSFTGEPGPACRPCPASTTWRVSSPSGWTPGTCRGEDRSLAQGQEHLRRQEVVGGWKPGKGNRTGQIGSLLVGVHDAGGLVYAGHVGTGFTEETLRLLTARLDPLHRDLAVRRPAAPRACARRGLGGAAAGGRGDLHGWTTAGRMRAPLYQGLRADKDPAEVIREPAWAPIPKVAVQVDERMLTLTNLRQGPVSGERVHQGRGARLLPAGRAHAAAAHRQAGH